VKIDMQQLKHDIKTLAEQCAKAKRDYKQAHRALSLAANTPGHLWQTGVNLSRAISEAHAAHRNAAYNMTQLCVFRASLRGRRHMAENSYYADRVDGWIENLTGVYACEETQEAAG
jgi:hypothetical protein